MPHTYDIFGDEFRKAEGFYGVIAALGGTHLVRTPRGRPPARHVRALETFEVR